MSKLFSEENKAAFSNPLNLNNPIAVQVLGPRASAPRSCPDTAAPTQNPVVPHKGCHKSSLLSLNHNWQLGFLKTTGTTWDNFCILPKPEG